MVAIQKLAFSFITESTRNFPPVNLNKGMASVFVLTKTEVIPFLMD